MDRRENGPQGHRGAGSVGEYRGVLSWRTLRDWFRLSGGEQLVVAGLIAIFLTGLVARYLYLRGLESDPVGVETEERGH